MVSKTKPVTVKVGKVPTSTDASKVSVESRLTQLIGVESEAEVEKILGNLKTHGLNKNQVLALVETIRDEEEKIIFADKIKSGELKTNEEDLMDEADLATSDIEQGMNMRMANRENFKVKRLYRALDKIKDGSYGECEGCSADIGFARLSARVIADLCIACKEEEERKETLSAIGRKHKSLGQGLSNKMTVV